MDYIFIDKEAIAEGESTADAELNRVVQRLTQDTERLTQDTGDLEAGIQQVAEQHEQKAAVGKPPSFPSTTNSLLKSSMTHSILNSVETGVTVLSSKDHSGNMPGNSNARLSKANWKRWFGYKSTAKSYDQLKQDFIVEMRILSKLRHPCITTVRCGSRVMLLVIIVDLSV